MKKLWDVGSSATSHERRRAGCKRMTIEQNTVASAETRIVKKEIGLNGGKHPGSSTARV